MLSYQIRKANDVPIICFPNVIILSIPLWKFQETNSSPTSLPNFLTISLLCWASDSLTMCQDVPLSPQCTLILPSVVVQTLVLFGIIPSGGSCFSYHALGFVRLVLTFSAIQGSLVRFGHDCIRESVPIGHESDMVQIRRKCVNDVEKNE